MIPHRLRLRPLEHRERPAVSVVIPSRGNAEPALASVQERTSYEPLESIVEEAEGSFRPAALANRGARRSDAEYIVFLGEDAEVTEPDWIEQLLLYAELPGSARSGPTLIRPDGRVSAAGFAIGLYDPAVPAMRGFDGRWRRLLRLRSVCAREVSAIGDGVHARAPLATSSGSVGSRRPTAASSRTTTSACGCGAGASSDLRAGARGRSTTRPRRRRRSDFDVVDRALFVDRWYERLAAGDPYYSRGFFRAVADYSLPPFGGDALELALRETVG